MRRLVKRHIQKVPISVRQFIKFSAVGVTNTAIDLLTYLFFTRVLGVFYLIANVFAFVLSVTNSYFLNRKFTFKSKQNKKMEYSLFVMVMASGLVLAEIILFTSVEFFAATDITGKIVAIVIGVFYNFFVSKRFVFKIRKVPKIFERS